jgi:putative SOS response-associated peptidase YedK
MERSKSLARSVLRLHLSAYVRTISGEQLAGRAGALVQDERARANVQQRYNAAPGQHLLIVLRGSQAGKRRLVTLRWGLIPFWAKDAKIGYSTINAMAETVATKPAFRDAFKSRRCLVPADGFHEWQQLDAKTKRPHRIVMTDGPSANILSSRKLAALRK